MPAPTLDRRTWFGLAAGAALGACQSQPRPRTFAHLERTGRLGVAVLDTGTGKLTGHRVNERFALCSTFKLVLAAVVLDRDARGGRALRTQVPLAAADLLAHAPVSRARWAEASARGLPTAHVDLATLAHAAVTTSDNTAANLLLRDLGGPAAVTAFCRDHGDLVTRLDRYEPAMNRVGPGDERDTTTPRAMVNLVARLLGPDGLLTTARATLRGWLLETTTGLARVRAGLPADWVAGDKTGTGAAPTTAKVNDVVWIEPPGRAPLVVAAYYDTGRVAEWPSADDEAVLAEVGRLIAGR